MYLDNVNCKRNGFIYYYTGGELLPGARAAYLKHLRAEVKARESAQRMLGDISVSQSSPELRQARADIEANGKLREECAVYVRQFEREPDREFPLFNGDVVFFGLVPDPSPQDLAAARE